MLDLQAPLFTQKSVLELLPSLPAKTLQNWLSRGIVTLEVQNPGRQAKRYYTPYGVIVLAFMNEMSKHKVGPTDALQLGHIVASRAQLILDNANWKADDLGIRYIDIPNENAGKLVRHVVNRDDDSSRVWLSESSFDLHQNYPGRKNYPPIYTVVETDIFLVNTINSMVEWMIENPRKINKKRPPQ